MSGRQDKRARGIAMAEAKRRNLWGAGEDEVYSMWHRRFLRRVFPKYTKHWSDIIGRWYRSNVKRWSKQVRASVHDKEAQEFSRVTRKLHRQHAREMEAKR